MKCTWLVHPYEWRSGTSDGLFLPIYPPRSMRVVLWFLMTSKFLDILEYCYENYAHNVYVKEFIERMNVGSKENNDMHESIDNYDSGDLIEISLDEHDACYPCGHDANIYEDEFAIVPYVNMRSLLLHPYLIFPSMKSEGVLD